MCGRAPLTQRIDDAAALAITDADILVQMELFVRSQMRRGYVDTETAALLLADIDNQRRRNAEYRAQLAALRNGNGKG